VFSHNKHTVYGILYIGKGKARAAMLLTEEVREKLPKLYSQGGRPAAGIKVITKFFDPTGAWTWYVLEGEPVIDEAGREMDFQFFGFVKGFEGELGYFTLNELLHAKDGLTGLQALPIERDLHFGFEHTLVEVFTGKC